MSHQATAMMSGGGGAGQFGDTTLTKVFVGGLAWETHKDGMRAYFQQFGDILEAVVITDKNTGRSKGYGFVTFREPEAALRACIDPYPVIDGRRANCNLAYLGVNKSKTALTTMLPQYLQPYAAHVYGGGSSMRATMKSFQTAGGGASLMSFVPAADHGIQQGIPTYDSVYAAAGYSPYFSDYGYPLSYYQPYMVGLQQGGQLQQYAAVGGTAAAAPAANPSVGPYSYFQYGPASAAAAGGPYSMVQYPQLYQYAAAVAAGATAAPTTLAAGVVAGGLQQYGGAVAFTPNSIAQAAGMTMSLTSPAALAAAPTTAQQFQYSGRLVPSSPPAAAAADQKPGLA